MHHVDLQINRRRLRDIDAVGTQPVDAFVLIVVWRAEPDGHIAESSYPSVHAKDRRGERPNRIPNSMVEPFGPVEIQPGLPFRSAKSRAAYHSNIAQHL